MGQAKEVEGGPIRLRMSHTLRLSDLDLQQFKMALHEITKRS
jgi:hypothetical protein